ncbi:MAG: diacylglycerol kinase family protein [Nitrospirota bacterium]|nr:diacylglycerol kinase family protein [Nitrospirota bacterium]
MKPLIILIGNPAARKSTTGKIDHAAAFLREKGFGTETCLTEKRGDAERLAHEGAGKKPFLIIACGGDGTINEVINGIARSDTPLAILPLGTTNVLAKELSIPEDVKGALETAISKTPKTVSLGKIVIDAGTSTGPDGTPEVQAGDSPGYSPQAERYFCLMAGIGFDGETVHDVNTSLKKISGKAAYIFSGINNFLNYRPDEIFFNIDGKAYSGYCAIIGKAGRYGGNFRATPDANLAEPSLYACIFKGGKRSDLLRYIFRIIRGSHLKEDDIIYLKASDIEIHGHAHIQIDGDYLGVTPARLSVEKDALKIIY